MIEYIHIFIFHCTFWLYTVFVRFHNDGTHMQSSEVLIAWLLGGLVVRSCAFCPEGSGFESQCHLV